MIERQFGIENLIGLSHSKITPSLTPDEVSQKCSKLGFAMVLEPADISYLSISELNNILGFKRIKIDLQDKIRETLINFGSPLSPCNYDSIKGYLNKSREIIGNELGEVPEFEVVEVCDTRDYEQESNKKEFLCSSLYQGIMVTIDKKGKLPIKLPFLRVSPYIGAYFTHGEENNCQYILFALDENLLLSSFSEPIHSLASRFTRKAVSKTPNLQTALIEETFVEGAAEFLFDKYRSSLGVPNSFVLKPAQNGIYSLSSLSKKWIERNRIKTAFELYQESPGEFVEIIKRT